MAVTALLAGMKVLLSMRDTIRDLTTVVGSNTSNPPTGLIGEVRRMNAKVESHHEWLVRSGLDRRASERQQAEEQYQHRQQQVEGR